MKEIDTVRFSEKVHEYRTHMNYNLRQAADMSGVSLSSLSRCENGGYPDLDTYIRICRWMRLPLTEFLNQPFEKVKTKPEVAHKSVILSAIKNSKELTSEHKSMLKLIIEWAYEISRKKKA